MNEQRKKKEVNQKTTKITRPNTPWLMEPNINAMQQVPNKAWKEAHSTQILETVLKNQGEQISI